MTPIKLIKALRKTDLYIECIFTGGACYQFHLFLKTVFSNAEPYINLKRDHVVTKIDGKLYDIKGIVKEKDFTPLNETDLKLVKKWSFRKNNMLQITECPFCEEPIIFNN